MKPWPTVNLGELHRLERRRANVESEKLYQEIGIYCFGRGIFHKAPRTGFEVGDKDLFLMKDGDFILQVSVNEVRRQAPDLCRHRDAKVLDIQRGDWEGRLVLAQDFYGEPAGVRFAFRGQVKRRFLFRVDGF